MNMQRFREVLAYIEAHPDEHEQTSCFTCFAAHAVKQIRGSWPQNLMDSFINGRLALSASPDEMDWIFHEDRTIDDFRTVARRSVA